MPGEITNSAPLRVLIVRLGAMGDVIHAMYAAATLRQYIPDLFLGWVVEEGWRELLCSEAAACQMRRGPGKPLVDVVHVVNTKAWRSALFSPHTWKQVHSIVRSVKAVGYDIAIDFQGACKSAVVAALSGAPARAGFRTPRETPSALFYNRWVAATAAHVIEQNLEMATQVAAACRYGLGMGTFPATVEPLPAHPAVPPVPFPHSESAVQWCEHELQRRGISSSPFAVLNPGAGWGAKCWPAERYAAVARGLEQLGLRTLVNHAPREEPLARLVETESGGAAQPLSCSISELIALMRRARLLIGGDTGPMHLAAALGVPVVAIFGPTDPARTGPYGTASVVLRNAASRISHARHASPEQGLLAISADEVLSAARQLLEKTLG